MDQAELLAQARRILDGIGSLHIRMDALSRRVEARSQEATRVGQTEGETDPYRALEATIGALEAELESVRADPDHAGIDESRVEALLDRAYGLRTSMRNRLAHWAADRRMRFRAKRDEFRMKQQEDPVAPESWVSPARDAEDIDVEHRRLWHKSEVGSAAFAFFPPVKPRTYESLKDGLDLLSSCGAEPYEACGPWTTVTGGEGKINRARIELKLDGFVNITGIKVVAHVLGEPTDVQITDAYIGGMGVYDGSTRQDAFGYFSASRTARVHASETLTTEVTVSRPYASVRVIVCGLRLDPRLVGAYLLKKQEKTFNVTGGEDGLSRAVDQLEKRNKRTTLEERGMMPLKSKRPKTLVEQAQAHKAKRMEARAFRTRGDIAHDIVTARRSSEVPGASPSSRELSPLGVMQPAVIIAEGNVASGTEQTFTGIARADFWAHGFEWVCEDVNARLVLSEVQLGRRSVDMGSGMRSGDLGGLEAVSFGRRFIRAGELVRFSVRNEGQAATEVWFYVRGHQLSPHMEQDLQEDVLRAAGDRVGDSPTVWEVADAQGWTQPVTIETPAVALRKEGATRIAYEIPEHFWLTSLHVRTAAPGVDTAPNLYVISASLGGEALPISSSSMVAFNHAARGMERRTVLSGSKLKLDVSPYSRTHEGTLVSVALNGYRLDPKVSEDCLLNLHARLNDEDELEDDEDDEEFDSSELEDDDSYDEDDDSYGDEDDSAEAEEKTISIDQLIFGTMPKDATTEVRLRWERISKALEDVFSQTLGDKWRQRFDLHADCVLKGFAPVFKNGDQMLVPYGRMITMGEMSKLLRGGTQALMDQALPTVLGAALGIDEASVANLWGSIRDAQKDANGGKIDESALLDQIVKEKPELVQAILAARDRRAAPLELLDLDLRQPETEEQRMREAEAEARLAAKLVELKAKDGGLCAFRVEIEGEVRKSSSIETLEALEVLEPVVLPLERASRHTDGVLRDDVAEHKVTVISDMWLDRITLEMTGDGDVSDISVDVWIDGQDGEEDLRPDSASRDTCGVLTRLQFDQPRFLHEGQKITIHYSNVPKKGTFAFEAALWGRRITLGLRNAALAYTVTRPSLHPAPMDAETPVRYVSPSWLVGAATGPAAKGYSFGSGTLMLPETFWVTAVRVVSDARPPCDLSAMYIQGVAVSGLPTYDGAPVPVSSYNHIAERPPRLCFAGTGVVVQAQNKGDALLGLQFVVEGFSTGHGWEQFLCDSVVAYKEQSDV